jgi:ribosomal RNA-processing protein 8
VTMAKSTNSSPLAKKKKETPHKKMTKVPPKKSSSTKVPSKSKHEKDTSPTKKGGSVDPAREVWSKSKKKRMRQKMAGKMRPDDSPAQESVERQSKKQKKAIVETDADSRGDKGKISSLKKSFMARLTGSRFRELNEELYTSTSSSAFEKFSSQPELYEQYHEGFRHQVESWPINPVNVIVKWLSSSYASKEAQCIVADFGCGDAALAKKLLAIEQKGKCPFKVHSFDLVACCDLVTACDMSKVPLNDKSVDVAVFCLSLMGTNLADFIREAHRVLKSDGVLKIAEVRSRFESKKDELDDFVSVLGKLGFVCARTDRSNKMFVMLELRLNGKKPAKNLEYEAKPCIYKRR